MAMTVYVATAYFEDEEPRCVGVFSWAPIAEDFALKYKKDHPGDVMTVTIRAWTLDFSEEDGVDRFVYSS
jgi:hypothetical protein